MNDNPAKISDSNPDDEIIAIIKSGSARNTGEYRKARSFIRSKSAEEIEELNSKNILSQDEIDNFFKDSPFGKVFADPEIQNIVKEAYKGIFKPFTPNSLTPSAPIIPDASKLNEEIVRHHREMEQMIEGIGSREPEEGIGIVGDQIKILINRGNKNVEKIEVKITYKDGTVQNQDYSR